VGRGGKDVPKVQVRDYVREPATSWLRHREGHDLLIWMPYPLPFCFRNANFDGRNQIMNALLAVVVPIYFGAPDVAKYA
jgi:hypothetical protein